MRTFIIDMMSGDLGSAATKEAVLSFHKDHPDYQLVLVGKKEELSDLEGFEIIEADKIVRMDAGAMEILHDKESSMVKAIYACRDRHADGVISAGGTGAFLTASTLILKKIPGVNRPALVTEFPNLAPSADGYTTILDCGASNRNTPEELAQFAVMGSVFNKAVRGNESPRVKLLSNGTEDAKGSPESKEAFKIIKQQNKVNFLGNIEANQVTQNGADVVVCDGYVGNVLLKSTEGVAKGMGAEIKKVFKRNLFSKIGYLFEKKGVKAMSKKLDPKNVGGAMLLGINGVAVKAHGNSDARGFRSAMEVGYRMIEAEIVSKIQKGLEESNG